MKNWSPNARYVPLAPLLYIHPNDVAGNSKKQAQQNINRDYNSQLP